MQLDPLDLSNLEYLSGFHSLRQYIIDGNLITIIGEYHGKNPKNCHKKSLPVDIFLLEVLKRPNTFLFLEYPPQKNIKDVSYDSANMMKLKNSLVKNNLTNKVFGFDIRRKYIKSDNLYEEKSKYLTIKQLFDEFLYPIVKNMHDIFSFKDLEDQTYLREYVESKLRNILWFCKSVIPKLKQQYDWNTPLYKIKKIMIHPETNTSLLEFFRKFWADVVDFYVLKLILTKDMYTHKIFLIGENHANNLHDVYHKYSILFNREVNGCVDIKNLKI